MDSRGTVRTEWLMVVVPVALLGIASLSHWGESAANALHGGGSVAVSGATGGGGAAMVTSAQAGQWNYLGKGLDALRALASADELTPVIKSEKILKGEEHVASLVGRVEWSDQSVRLGVPDHVHEAPQALRYADMEGGGLWFVPTERFAQGIDGYFVAWRSEVPVDLLHFDSAHTTPDTAAVAVSLKDFTIRSERIRDMMGFTRAKAMDNAAKVVRAQNTPPAAVPKVVATDLFISIPRTMDEVKSELVRHKEWSDVLRGHNVTEGERRAFRRVVFEATDGTVVFTLKTRGQAVGRSIQREGKPEVWLKMPKASSPFEFVKRHATAH